MPENEQAEIPWTCCNDKQSLFLLLYIAFGSFSFIFLKSVFTKPLRLLTTFMHEFSHALACWATGGDVKAIQVYNNEGGVTHYAGGWRWAIIPAGYVGASITAMIFVIMSGGRKTATVAAILFVAALVASLCYSPNRTMVYLNLSYALIIVTCLLLEWFVFTPLLQFVILFLGVFAGIAAIADIHSDTVVRTVEGSDAYACYIEVCCRCCPPPCIGLQWIVMAIIFQVFGAWCALVQMSNECEDLGWFQCFHITVDWDLTDRWNWNFDGFWHND
jgi:Peptidase M50B-like